MPWLLAARPKTLLASISPVFLGLGLARRDGFFDPMLAALVLVTAVLIQVLTNYINDYYDFKKGADTKDRLGPIRMLQAGRIQPTTMKKAIFALFFLCLLLGMLIVQKTDHYILIAGIVSLLFAYGYTGGPYPLAYNGLGEVFVFLFFGPVAVLGSYYTQLTCCFDTAAAQKVMLASTAPGLLAALILMANNIRDHAGDLKNQKNTLVVKLGLPLSKKVYASLAVLVISVPFLLTPHLGSYALFSLVILPPLAFSVVKVYLYRDPRELNPLIGLNGVILFLFCLSVIAGAS